MRCQTSIENWIMLIETKAISRKCWNRNHENYERNIYFICIILTNNSEGTAFNHHMYVTELVIIMRKVLKMAFHYIWSFVLSDLHNYDDRSSKPSEVSIASRENVTVIWETVTDWLGKLELLNVPDNLWTSLENYKKLNLSPETNYEVFRDILRVCFTLPNWTNV